MSEFKITCCSTIDMPADFLQTRNIPCLPYHFEMDGVDYPDDLGETMSFADFYARMDEGSMPVTSQINMETYINFFETFLAAGVDVLHFAMSSGITGSVNSARMAQAELQQKYPDRRLHIVDTLCTCSGYGLFMDTVWTMREGGASMDEIRDFAEENKTLVQHWFFAENLTHFWRGGRVSRASAVVGSLLRIIPLLNVNLEGKLIPREKIRGKKHVINATFEKMKAHARDGANYNGKCFIAHAARPEDAEALAALIRAEFKHLDGDVQITSIGKVVGSHTGSGTIALFFWGDRRAD